MSDSFTKEYHSILSSSVPPFLDKYLKIPLLSRLSGVGLLCGTDWCGFFHNKFFYSRLDHSYATALITWHFTHQKEQTVAALLHDASTPAFSHVIDFMEGDSLTQSRTEDSNSQFILHSAEITDCLRNDNVLVAKVLNYKMYPIIDTEIPRLCADRLAYMYPSAACLSGLWTADEIRANYKTLKVLKNERGGIEVGFGDREQCLIYARKFLEVGLFLQQAEDKAAMQLMADVVRSAIDNGIIKKSDLYSQSEASLIALFDGYAKKNPESGFSLLFRTFRAASSVVRSDKPMDGFYCVNVDVKKRYVDPVVEAPGGAVRISTLVPEMKKAIDDFLSYEDAPFACVKYVR